MRYLRTNTAVRVTVGPFLDKTDGITPEVALTATNEHLTLMVDDGNVPTLVLDANATVSGGNNDMVHVTNDDAGFYDLELTAAQTNYVGRAMLSINYVTDHCPVWHEFTILPAQVYDSLILGSDLLDANAAQLGGTTQTGRDVGASVLLSVGTGTGQVNLSSGAVPVTGDLTATMKTSVNGEVVDALNVDTYAEPGQEAPGATVSLTKKIGYLYKAWRNKATQTATTMSLYADDASTVDQKATVSDDSTTFTRGEIGSGP